MALEKMSSGMPMKQKLMMIAIVVIFIVVIWQVVGLLGIGGGSSSVPPVVPKPAAQQMSKAPSTASSASTPTMNPAMPAQAANANTASQQAQVDIRQAPVSNDPQFLQQQQENEKKYINQVNSLEDLKIQRAIAETNQAIATAKLATVAAEKNISDLLTKPAVQELPPSAYANKLVNSGPNGMQVEVVTEQQNSVEYTVISIVKTDRWSAVIGFQGKLYNVMVGDVLPPDNSVVTSINKNGVILKRNGQTRKVSIMSSI